MINDQFDHELENIKTSILFSSKRQSQRNMLELCWSSRPSRLDPGCVDACFNLSAQWLRFNVDQDTLFFVMNFASAVSNGGTARGGGEKARLEYLKSESFSALGATASEVLPPPDEIGEEVFEDAREEGSISSGARSARSSRESTPPDARTAAIGHGKGNTIIIKSFTFSPEVSKKSSHAGSTCNTCL